MDDFAQLLAAIQAVADDSQTLAKSLPTPTPEIEEDEQALVPGTTTAPAAAAPAAAPAAADTAATAAVPAAVTPATTEGEQETQLTKSLMIDGEPVEVIDADGLLKSLGALEERIATTVDQAQLTKCLNPMLELIQGQNTLIKSMGERLEALAGSGRGRKAVLTITERPAPGEQVLAKSDPVQLSVPDLLAKSLKAQREGKITGADVARVEVALQSGLSAPADVLARI